MDSEMAKITPSIALSDMFASTGLELVSAMDSETLAGTLAKAGTRGRLPGFVAQSGDSFRVDCNAVPFEYRLIGQIEDRKGVGSVVRLRLVRRKLMPIIFVIVIALSIWPGVWLTDSIMGVYWSAYSGWSAAMPWLTYAWYLPITVLPLPWMWRSFVRKSQSQAGESATKLLTAIQRELGIEG